MEKIEFKDLPDTTTPLSASNLNLLQSNVESWLKPTGYSNVDLNDFKQTGVYYFKSGCTNTPKTYMLTLVIGNGGEPTFQLGISMSTRIYFRTFANGTWSNWRLLAGTELS